MREFKRIIDNYKLEENSFSAEKVIEEIEFLKNFFISNTKLEEKELLLINQYILEKSIFLICNDNFIFGKEIPLFYLSYIEEYSKYITDNTLNIIVDFPKIINKIEFVFLNLPSQKLPDFFPVIIRNCSISLIEKIIKKYGYELASQLFTNNIHSLITFSIEKIKWVINNKFLSQENIQIFLKNIADIDNNKNDEILISIKKCFHHVMDNETLEFYNNSLVLQDVLNSENKNQLLNMFKNINIEKLLKHKTLNNSNFLHYLFKSPSVSYVLKLWTTKKYKRIIVELLKEKNNNGFTPLDHIFKNWDYVAKIWKIKEIFYYDNVLSHPKIDLLYLTNSTYNNETKEILNILSEKGLLLQSINFSENLNEPNYNDILKISDILEPYLLSMIDRGMIVSISEEDLIYLTALVCFMSNDSNKDNLYKVNLMKYLLKHSVAIEKFLEDLPVIRKNILNNSDLSKSQLKEYHSVEKIKQMNLMIKIVKDYLKMKEMINSDEMVINKKRL